MSLRARPRVVVLAIAAVLVALGLWAVLDDPKVESTYFEAATVQCRSVSAGAGTAAVVPEDQNPADDAAVLDLDDTDVVHEDASVLDPSGLPTLNELEDADRSDASDVVAALRDTAETCDAARTHRVFLAGLCGLPATLLLALGALARHDDRPRPRRGRLLTVDPAFRS